MQKLSALRRIIFSNDNPRRSNKSKDHINTVIYSSHKHITILYRHNAEYNYVCDRPTAKLHIFYCVGNKRSNALNVTYYDKMFVTLKLLIRRIAFEFFDTYELHY